MLIGTVDLYQFVPLSATLTVSGRSQGQHKAEPEDFISSHAFQWIRMKFDVVMKQFKLYILMLYLSVESRHIMATFFGYILD